MNELNNLSNIRLNNNIEKNNAETLINSLPPDMITCIFSYLALLDWKKSAPLFVCKHWKNCSELAIKNLIAKFFIGTDKWAKKWPLNEKYTKAISLLPESTMPETIKLDFHQFINKRCPFNPEKLFIETHLITYIGKELSITSRSRMYGPWDIHKIFPMSIDAVDQIYGENVLIDSSEAKRGILGNHIKKKTVEKAKWIALYKEPIYISKEKGFPRYPSVLDNEKINIAKKNGYRQPTVLEYGISFYANSFTKDESYEPFGTKWLKWEEGDRKHYTMSKDREDFKVNNEEAFLYVCPNSRVRVTCKQDLLGDCALMLCKEL